MILKLKDADIQTKCIEVDKFWQQCPMLNHYLHPADTDTWPNPWELLNDNNYCLYARALGMVYTLLLLGIDNIDLIDAIDYNEESAVLISIDHAKYMLNGSPNLVLNTNLTEFKIKQYISLEHVVRKIGN